MTEDNPADDADAPAMTRRRLVAMGATGWATVSLAGCSRVLDPSTREDGDDDGSGDGNQTTDTTGNTTVTNETTTTGGSGNGTSGSGTSSCSMSEVFASGMDVGLHVGVFDETSGNALGDETVEDVTVEFPDTDFDSVQLNWQGDHEEYDASTWGGKIETSEDTESGTYRYEVTVDRTDGETQTVVDEFTIA